MSVHHLTILWHVYFSFYSFLCFPVRLSFLCWNTCNLQCTFCVLLQQVTAWSAVFVRCTLLWGCGTSVWTACGTTCVRPASSWAGLPRSTSSNTQCRNTAMRHVSPLGSECLKATHNLSNVCRQSWNFVFLVISVKHWDCGCLKTTASWLAISTQTNEV
jgi:hypothetical protein